VEDVIDVADVEGLADVFFYKLESGNRSADGEIGAAAGEQVVDDDHAPALAEQGIAEMGSQETGATGDQGAFWAHAFLVRRFSGGGRRRDERRRVPRCNR
jgi:hypothetical protein